MKNIQRFILCLSFMMSITIVHADLGSSFNFEQAKDDVRVFLKQIYRVEQAYLTEYGVYTSDLGVLAQLGFQIPAHINQLGRVAIYTGPNSTLRVIFYATHSVFLSSTSTCGSSSSSSSSGGIVAYPTYEINQEGRLSRLAQWNTVAELIQETDEVLGMIRNAETAFYVEFNRYSANLAELGVTIPPYIYPIAKFTLRINPDGSFFAEVKGGQFPLVGYSKVTGSIGH